MLLNQDSITTFVLVAMCLNCISIWEKSFSCWTIFLLLLAHFVLLKRGPGSGAILSRFSNCLFTNLSFSDVFSPQVINLLVFLLSLQCTDDTFINYIYYIFIIFIQLYLFNYTWKAPASIKFFWRTPRRLRYSSPIMLELSCPVYSLNDKTNVL